ncbi:MAG: exo-alpha-sialidase [Candidatus Cryptobacteroides sp.]
MHKILFTLTLALAFESGVAGIELSGGNHPTKTGTPPTKELVKLSLDKDGSYCHNIVIGEFKGELYAQWQCSDRDEDAPDTRIFYCRSRDGKRWSRPRRLPIDISGVRFIANGGWWSYDDSLTCFVNVTALDGSKGCMFVRSADGRRWTQPRPVLTSSGDPVPGIIEQDLRTLPDGRILTAFHIGKDMICTPFFTDDPSALSGWTAGEMSHFPYPGKTTSREIEPSWYIAPDFGNNRPALPGNTVIPGGDAQPEDSLETIVMIFRDQANSYKKIEAVSKDRGKTWSAPRLTGIEDSRSKQSAGNLPDGRAFMVWNPSDSKDRWPLVIAVSTPDTDSDAISRASTGEYADPAAQSGPQTVTDAIRWTRTVLLDESDLSPMRKDGLYKRRGYSYPKSFVHDGYIYIGFAMNKEDAYVLRIRISDL